jgi:hypothetical protein
VPLWGLAGRIVVAWLPTLPAAALVAGLVHELADAIGSGATGAFVVAVVATAGAAALFAATQRQNALTAADV